MDGGYVTVQGSVYFILSVSLVSFFVALRFARQVIASHMGSADLQKMSAAITGGTGAFLTRQSRTLAVLLGLLLPTFAHAQADHAGGGEANLTLPDLKSVIFDHFFGLNGHALLTIGLLFCVGGLLFGLRFMSS